MGAALFAVSYSLENWSFPTPHRGADPILGEILKSSAGGNTVIGIACFGVVAVAANIAYIDIHFLVLQSQKCGVLPSPLSYATCRIL